MPDYFPDIRGNAETRTRFGRAVCDGTLSHAYILEGPEGSGKTLLATQIAAALVCERQGGTDTLPCGVCNRCRRVLSGNAPDVKTVSVTTATIGVDTVRELRADMYLSACELPVKVYLIDDAHKMTPQAQNALLKVLEEPPTDLVIFLLTERSEALLSTIRSRTQLIRMELLNPEEMEAALAKNVSARRLRERDPEAFRALLEGSGGCLGQALELLDGRRGEAYQKRHRAVSDAVRSIVTHAPYSTLVGILAALPTKRQELTEELGMYLAALRDLILTYRADNCDLVFYPTRREAGEIAAEAGFPRLLAVYDLVVRANEALAANANIPLTLQGLFGDFERLS